MKKDILLAVISEAIDKGAYISVHFGQYNKPDFEPVTKQEAFTLAQMVSDAIGVEVSERNSVRGVSTFSVNEEEGLLYFSTSYLEEDVNLSGSDFDDREAI